MKISIILRGMAMGIAEAIPGVSGGTIAFITGIYTRLLEAIGGILGPRVLGTLRKEGVAPAWHRNGNWPGYCRGQHYRAA